MVRPISPNAPRALFSGYYMSPDTFRQFVLSLPVNVVRPDDRDKYRPKDLGIILFIVAYLRWRRKLPKERKATAPIVKEWYQDGFERCGQDSHVKGLFFPVRWVQWTEEIQNDEGPRTETDKDRAHRNEFLKTLESVGAVLDVSKISFGCVKDIHPAYDNIAYE